MLARATQRCGTSALARGGTAAALSLARPLQVVWRKYASAVAAEEELIVEHRDQGVRVFTLARPKANALGRVLLAQLRSAIQEAAHDKSARCVILRSSSPKIFCA